MANTRDVIGEEVLLRKLIDGSITELEDDLVSELKSYAFYYNTKLESVKLPNCKVIHNYAFYMCNNLRVLEIPNCTYIGSNAIHSLAIEELIINSKFFKYYKGSGDCAPRIYGCNNLTKLILNGSFEYANGYSVVESCNSLTEVHLKCDKFVEYNQTAVKNCSNLKLFISEGGEALRISGCDNLETYVWKCTATNSSGPNSSAELQNSFIRYCPKIKNIVCIFNEGLTRISTPNEVNAFDICEHIYVRQDNIEWLKSGNFSNYTDKIVAVEGSEFERYLND